MRLRATRAETSYLRGMYDAIADNWSALAEAIDGAEMPPPTAMAVRKSAEL